MKPVNYEQARVRTIGATYSQIAAPEVDILPYEWELDPEGSSSPLLLVYGCLE